uniref:Chitin synthase chs-1/2 N-terminal putative transporter domain-containing protein n=1 Tax=Panagrolaimus superbus TaxID=310955 RepID=A0A914XY75_9BILA
MISICLGAAFLWGILGFNDNNKALPFAMVLYGIGNWETWIAKNHSEGCLKELFRLKYGLRKLNWTSRIVISLLRILTVIGCASYVVISKKLGAPHFLRFTNISHLSSETFYLQLLAISFGVTIIYRKGK